MMKPCVKALEYGENAIRFFNEYFYTYPYDDYSIVAADFYIGGMEYPNLVMIVWSFMIWEIFLSM